MSIRHVGIVVHWLDEMTEFYKRLGFEIYDKSNIESNTLQKLYGYKQEHMDLEATIVKLKSKKDDSIIELIKYKNFFLPTKSKEPYGKGITHFAINVDNLIELCSDLRKRYGTKFNSPIMETEYVKMCYARDVEGNYLELVETI